MNAQQTEETEMGKNIPPEVPSLDAQIAKTLAAPPTSSAPLLELIVRTTSEIEAVDEAGRIARARAIDPTVPDGVAERSRAEDNEFCAARYRAGLAELHRLHDTAVAVEQSIAWNENADRVQAERDHLAAEFRMRWPQLVQEAVDLFTAIGACDQAIDRLHAAAPATEGARRLRKVESEARDIDAITLQGAASIIDSAQLPRFAQHGIQLAWPMAKPSELLGLLDMFPKNGAPDPADYDRFEMFFDEAAGHFGMKLKQDYMQARESRD
jgi:hypothetical protein